MSSSEDGGGRPRKTSQSSRFEIEKVDEQQPTTSAEAAGSSENGEQSGNEAHKPALKKTVKHFEDDYDDSGTSAQQQQKSRLIERQTSGGAESDDEQPGCFQVIYDERNKPVSIVVNLQSNKPGGGSSGSDAGGSGSRCKDCIYDLKTVALYQKLIAEFLGTMLLTLYACSIGLPIAEENGVPSINGNLKK